VRTERGPGRGREGRAEERELRRVAQAEQGETVAARAEATASTPRTGTGDLCPWSPGRPRKGDSKPKGRSPEARRVHELEREIRRKDKALAEAAALLVLQKKVRDLLGGGDESTPPRSDA